MRTASKYASTVTSTNNIQSFSVTEKCYESADKAEYQILSSALNLHQRQIRAAVPLSECRQQLLCIQECKSTKPTFLSRLYVYCNTAVL
jgi:hypothetical protein